jgi:hypothetical protein
VHSRRWQTGQGSRSWASASWQRSTVRQGLVVGEAVPGEQEEHQVRLQSDRVLLPDGLKDLNNDGYPDLIGPTGDIPATYRSSLR